MVLENTLCAYVSFQIARTDRTYPIHPSSYRHVFRLTWNPTVLAVPMRWKAPACTFLGLRADIYHSGRELGLSRKSFLFRDQPGPKETFYNAKVTAYTLPGV